jgi:hypothetical protein
VTEPVVEQVIGVRDLPLGDSASRELVVRWSNGTEAVALRWYADEWLVSEGDLVGKTATEIRSLAHASDVQSIQDGGSTEFF